MNDNEKRGPGRPRGALNKPRTGTDTPETNKAVSDAPEARNEGSDKDLASKLEALEKRVKFLEIRVL